MVCVEDATPLIAIQSMFSLLYLPLRLSVQWSPSMIIAWDRFAIVLTAFKFALLTRAVVETLDMGMWPTNVGSQLWLLLCTTAFYHSVVQMLLTSTLQTGFAILSFFCGMSFVSPVWKSFEIAIQRLVLSVFGFELSLTGCLAIALVLLLMMCFVVFAIYWKGWINTLIISVLIIFDVVMSFHLLVYNIQWSNHPLNWLSSELCCNIPDLEIQSLHPDGNLCPLRFTWMDITVGSFMVVMFIPMEFYRREQCVPAWICCMKRSNALLLYRKQKGQPYYGMLPQDDNKPRERVSARYDPMTERA